MMDVKEAVLSLLFPRRCPICHDIVRPRGAWICPSCLKKVPFVQEPTCLRCGKEIASEEIEYCYDCSHHTRSFQKGYALAVYDPVMRESVRRFKNGGRMEYADWYAEALWQQYGKEWMRLELDLVVPVPLHRSRCNERGYNQAELLARRLARKLGVPVWPQALVRTRKTTAQKYLGGRERQRNLESVFALGPQAGGVSFWKKFLRIRWAERGRSLEGKAILLVDDIYTTGGTAEACTRVLLRAGAKAVSLVNICIGENDK